MGWVLWEQIVESALLDSPDPCAIGAAVIATPIVNSGVPAYPMKKEGMDDA